MNNKPTKKESDHLQWVKSQPCGVCNSPAPSEAHHVRQHSQYLAIPLCPDCHRGSRNGWHGQRVMWNIMKMDELDVLNETIRALASAP